MSTPFKPFAPLTPRVVEINYQAPVPTCTT